MDLLMEMDADPWLIQWISEALFERKAQIDRLERVQNAATRAVLGCTKDTHVVCMRYILDRTSFRMRHKVAVAKLYLNVLGHPKHPLDDKLSSIKGNRIKRGSSWMAGAEDSLRKVCGIDEICSGKECFELSSACRSLANIHITMDHERREWLAVSDLCSLLIMIWLSLCLNPLFYNSELPFDPMDIIVSTGGIPHVLFVKIATFITAFITFKRCLCIAVPLKVKTIITPGRTKTIIISIYVGMSVSMIPYYLGNRLEWVFDFNRNVTVLKPTAERELLEVITFLIQGVFTTFSFVFVISCTIVLIVKLNSKTKWRQATAAKSDRAAGGVGVKDQKVVKMVTFIAVIFIVCSVPPTLLFFYMVIDIDFRVGGVYRNLYLVIWTTSFLTETINSSVNIFVYLKMSSKYRAVFMKRF
ncbi:probable G-protein coupled receptor 139 [Aplysia californica]|uniref:Probable G-protein coupled receptor 139 n=1 Tax=Aplysia californica TaxID=6500 RepID=A0ABM1AD62_APLCA|nr:probable G-protein coupled receptor 139 [Aplysia californica]